MAASDSDRIGRRGRPRDLRLDEQITAAAIDVLAEIGFGLFSVEEVAARAGVAKTTVYRRFATRRDLIAGALNRLGELGPRTPPPGPVRDRLSALLRAVRDRKPEDAQRRILMRASAETMTSPELVGLVEELVLAPRRRILLEVLAEAVDAGELRPDVSLDLMLPVLVGPMLYLGTWGGAGGMADVTVEDVVDAVLTGLRTPASGS